MKHIIGTVKWAERLHWPGASAWLNADRRSLTVDGIIEGYLKKYGNFNFYWILRSGHMVNKMFCFFIKT